jgi:hypothetical protein
MVVSEFKRTILLSFFVICGPHFGQSKISDTEEWEEEFVDAVYRQYGGYNGEES